MIFREEYAVVVGDNWNWDLVDTWRPEHPEKPFVGLRIDAEDVWVVCEVETASGSLPAATLQLVRSVSFARHAVSGMAFGWRGPLSAYCERYPMRTRAPLEPVARTPNVDS